MKKMHSTSAQPQNTQSYGWSFWLWIVAVLLAGFIVVIIGTAWTVKHAMTGGSRQPLFISHFAILVADFPLNVRSAIQEMQSQIEGDSQSLLMDRKTTEKPSWSRSFPSPADTGYLLFSGVDPVAKHSIVQLIRISDGKRVANWDPDWEAIYERISGEKSDSKGSHLNAIAVHPLLLADGDIVFNIMGQAMVRLSPCSTKPVWQLNEMTHHSNELDESGNAIWVPSFSHDGYTENPLLQERLLDDSLAHVSIDGTVLENRSLARIIRDNGMKAMLLGRFGANLNTDPIHLNEIQVALRDSRYWHRGDLLISARHLSTVFLYRPSTNKIIWYQTGPWMNQHSVDFVDDHRISVFDNNIVSAIPNANAFLSPSDINQVFLYDFDTKQASQPFASLLAKARPVTITAGRARILPDGGLFVEETNSGRHLRFTKDRLLWSRINDYDKERIGIVSWSRYMTAEEASTPLQALASRRCKPSK